MTGSADLALIVFFAVAALAVSPWFLIGLGLVVVLFLYQETSEYLHPWKWRRR